MPNNRAKNAQASIINNFCSGHYVSPPYESPHQYRQRGYQPYGTEAIDLIGGTSTSDHGASMAGMIPDIFPLLDDLSGEKREEKAKLMKICLDRMKTALLHTLQNESVRKQLTNGEQGDSSSGSSTGLNDDDDNDAFKRFF